ncbi:MAG: 3-ketoacyl-ACP reductase [Bacteroidota bacterium]|nr:3-ketoacyl-ACP reductase [Bacteroidota bacterium]
MTLSLSQRSKRLFSKGLPPVILITGASRGLGRGIAVHAAQEGFSAVINYATQSRAAEDAVQECRSRQIDDSQQFLAIRADIGSPGGRKKLVEGTLKTFGRIDALINNAGIGPEIRIDVTEVSEKSFRRVLEVNLAGPHFLTQRVANYWLHKKPVPFLPSGFTVIFISSISAEMLSLDRSEYCISKAGLSMASQIWAARLGAAGVNVVELRPGIMATDMTSRVKEKYEKLFADGTVPQQRWGTADDVGKAAAAILKGSFPFSAGSVIHIDGGIHLKRL